jgi:hypothetical protein
MAELLDAFVEFRDKVRRAALDAEKGRITEDEMVRRVDEALENTRCVCGIYLDDCESNRRRNG